MEKIKNHENELTFAELEKFVNADWGYGGTLLYRAVDLDDIMLAKQCIQLNAEVNRIDSDACSALFYCKSLEMAKFLVDNGIDVNILNQDGETAVVHLYYMGKNSDIINYLAGITNLDLESGKNDSSTLLDKMITKQEENLSLYKIVIPRTKNINRIDDDSRSYLMNAVQHKKNLKVIKMLIESGIDLYIRDEDEKNFYDLAFKYVKKEIRKNYPEFMKRKDMTDQQRHRFDKLKNLNSISN